MPARYWHRLLLAVLVVILPAAVLPAQQQDGPPPGNAAAAKLKPLPGPAQPTPADRLPLDKLKVPDGFHIEVYASGLAKARALRIGKRGTVFVGSTGDKVFAIVDQDGQRAVKVIAVGPHSPERARLPRRHALHRRAHAHLQDR